ncbi:hypothetical protein BASA81_002164 [Batrachochytrium salamandrivorans]|nr:hypothetical protein BASA81_002164 [Batrachochytrium salamandrivorans]
MRMQNLWIWPVLLLAVTACSTGGLWFALMPQVPPVLRAGWRLLITSVLQLPMFLVNLQQSELGWGEYYDLLLEMIASGLALGAHFAAWSISLTLTSLSHSLLFVCTTPLLLVGYQATGYALCVFSNPPTWVESIGACIGVVAAGVLANEAGGGDGKGDHTVSLAGDFTALLGAAAMGIYLSLGAKVRQQVLLWMYVFPVTLVAGVVCVVGSWAFEPGSLEHSLLGANQQQDFYLAFGAAFTAGILGHTLANLALGYVSPLVVSVLLLSEPLIGSLLGYWAGVQSPPSPTTIACGVPLMLAAALVTVGNFPKGQE